MPTPRPGTSRARWRQALLGLFLVGLFACAHEPSYPVRRGSAPRPLEGVASWYGYPHHGRLTASGQRFNMYQLTAAHQTLPLGTRVRVTNLHNGRSVVVTITDRGPYLDGRVIDLSYAAARRIGMIDPGTAPVRLVVLR
jgi:rare lipoprotein A